MGQGGIVSWVAVGLLLDGDAGLGVDIDEDAAAVAELFTFEHWKIDSKSVLAVPGREELDMLEVCDDENGRNAGEAIDEGGKLGPMLLIEHEVGLDPENILGVFCIHDSGFDSSQTVRGKDGVLGIRTEERFDPWR